MVSKRNRILRLTQFIESCGIKVNIGKNKALGNNGFFKARNDIYRIDIAKNQSEDSILRVLSHEFAHFIHYKHDKTLKSLDFIFDSSDEILEELISLTVATISKTSIQPLFIEKDKLKNEVDNLLIILKDKCPDIGNNGISKRLEQEISRTKLKYLLKYDRVKVLELCGTKIYSVEDLDGGTEQELYLKLLSKKRKLRRINARITKLNKYYNMPTELFARSFETFVTDSDLLKKIAPNVWSYYIKAIQERKIPLLVDFINNID